MISQESRTARAIIRDESLRLFAERGPDAVTVRQIAAAARVSPALVIHHFGSKKGLRTAVDSYVTGVFDILFRQMSSFEWRGQGAGASLAELTLSHLPPDSPIPAYLRRLWLTGEEPGLMIFRHWYELTCQMMERLAGDGVVRASDDPAVRSAFVMVNDLAALLLRDQLSAALGFDPLTSEGMARWAGEALAVYRDGLFAPGAPK
jgi:AcrR family transcriptional regulator